MVQEGDKVRGSGERGKETDRQTEMETETLGRNKDISWTCG